MRTPAAFSLCLVFSTLVEGFSPSSSTSTFIHKLPRSAVAMSLTPTPIDDVPAIISKVASKSDEWKSKPISEKVDILRLILSNAIDEQDEWTAAAERARGIHPTNPRHGSARADVLTSGPATFAAYLNSLISTLDHCARNDGAPPRPERVRTLSNNMSVATLWPATLLDKLEAVGATGELVLGDEDAEQMSYDEACAEGGTSGILGAGNVDAPIELLCELFLRGRVCVYKPNPVNEGQHRVVRRILDPLISAGYLEYLVGGAEVGSAIVGNQVLDRIVLTGSRATYERIKPLAGDTPICAELGGVNPWIVVPGKRWNRRKVDQHARSLAFARLSNNGHTCAAPQVVIIDKQWEWRQLFMERVRYWMGEYAGAPPFYPGSAETHSFFASLSGAEIVPGDNAFENQQRPVILANVLASDLEGSSPILNREAFCPVLAEVVIDKGNDEDSMNFLRSAIDFSGNNCFGSLAANIIIPDDVVKENENEFDNIIAEMPFGIIGVNIWPAFAHSVAPLCWGAPPGHEQSGSGFLGNAYLFQRPQKTVLRAPFGWLGSRALSVMPPKRHEQVFRRLTTYKARPNLATQALLFTALFLGL